MSQKQLEGVIYVADAVIASSDETFHALFKELHYEACQVRAVDVFSSPPLFSQFVYFRDQVGIHVEHKAGRSDAMIKRAEELKKSVIALLALPVPAAVSRFPTIKDDAFRTILERDLKEAEDSFRRANWKACIVLCGSILEAALYEYLRRNPAWTMKQSNVPQEKSGAPKDISDKFGRWDLHELIKFYSANGLLAEDSKTLDQTLKDPRNLIHPMREIRGAGEVDRETAAVCLAMTEKVLKQLAALPEPA